MNFTRRTGLLDSLALACLVSLLILPLFRLSYLDNWKSIESTFIADARMLSEHSQPGWQPLWYCGHANGLYLSTGYPLRDCV